MYQDGPQPVRVAVIGGGCAAMATAFELTRPEHRGRYEVTVYQMGWRLGGKGASGRGPADRIEEHGLHLWMGFYENAFRIMRECYAELGRDPRSCRIATWQDAFKAAPNVSVVDREDDLSWQPWLAYFPPRGGFPGDPLEDLDPLSALSYLQQTATLLFELIRSAAGEPTETEPPAWPGGVSEVLETILRYGRLASLTALAEATRVLHFTLQTATPAGMGFQGSPVHRLIDMIDGAARELLQKHLRKDRASRRVWQVVDLVLAILRGSVWEGLAFHPQGFDAINDRDWRAWLRSYGASDESLNSGFMRGIYDLVFAYEGGDPQRPSLAAGVALRGAMRMFFTCRGALFWKMSAGMGDIVFAPFYEVLKARGVRFKFFHRVSELVPGPERHGSISYIEKIRLDVQAETKAEVYEPLVLIDGLPCWPARPLFEQLVDGDRIAEEGRQLEAPWEMRGVRRKTLKVGEDFDLAVLAVGLGAVRFVAPELIQRSPRWSRQVRHGATVATQALQLWMREDMRELGWLGPSRVTLSGFVTPFDTWADMGHLIEEESWPGVCSLAYFCSALKEHEPTDLEAWESHAREQRERVRDNALRFLRQDIGALWPKAVDRARRFRWHVLSTLDPQKDACGTARFDDQFWIANVNPSERYSLSLPGTIQHRLSPLDLDFDNLTVAGDWTRTGLDSGCVESAVMSGLLAAHALSCSPPLEDIVGYDHP